MKLDARLAHLETLVAQSLTLWDLPEGAAARLINVSENTTYLVEAPCGFKAVLRVHRQGYHSARAIESELSWLAALRQDSPVVTPKVIFGRNGDAVQTNALAVLPCPQRMVMFEHIAGEAPREAGDLVPDFHELGVLAAHCHTHALGWQRPDGFERMHWDVPAVFGESATWGDWRDAPGVDTDVRALLEKVEEVVRSRLAAYGSHPSRFNLIHADMRLANLIIGSDGTRVIDFDDCGFGWLMYDFAAAISFFEDDPRIPDLKTAWLRGYRSVRALSPADEDEIDTFIMLRRMALLAWIGSHIEAPEPQALAPDFARVTAELGRNFLARLPNT
ncbi:MAG: phosphotransferase [Pseudomonadota bacterium]